MQILSTCLIVIAGVINFLPLAGVLSRLRMQALYGVVIEGPNLEILMRHRAVLLGIVGGLMLISAFHLPLRTVGYAVGFINMLAFALVVWVVGDANPELRRVALIDLVASLLLLGALLIDHLGGASRAGA